VVVGQTLPRSKVEAKVTSLRRAATFLLIFGMCSAHHLSGWLAVLAAIAILCASPATLSCRARCAKRLCIAVAALVSISLVAHLIFMYKGMPQRFALAVQAKCTSMPTEAYLWTKGVMLDLHDGRNHMDDEAATVTEHGNRMLEAFTLILSPALNLEIPQDSAEVQIEQERSCGMLAHCVSRFGSMLLLISTASNFFLLVAALAVARRACCLGCCIKHRAIAAAAADLPTVVVKPVLG